MNSNAVLALIGDMYAQLAEAQDRIAALEQELAESPREAAANGVSGAPATERPSSGLGAQDSG